MSRHDQEWEEPGSPEEEEPNAGWPESGWPESEGEEWESWPEEDDWSAGSEEEPVGEEDAEDVPVMLRDPEIEGGCPVRLEPGGITIVVEPGTALIDVARAAGRPVAQSCGGWGICSWCKMRVLEGLDNLSPVEPVEARLIIRQSFAPDERASCQAEVLGPVTVTTTYW